MLWLVWSSSLSSCQLVNLKIQFSVIILSSFSYIVNKGKTLKYVIYNLLYIMYVLYVYIIILFVFNKSMENLWR